jgi:hypothetical protein
MKATAPRIRIYVDGKTEFDGKIDQWTTTPPDFIKDRIRPGFLPEPWAKAVMLSMTDAVIARRSLDITVKTKPKCWTMTVEER